MNEKYRGISVARLNVKLLKRTPYAVAFAAGPACGRGDGPKRHISRKDRGIMLILGLNMFHADASAAIVQDGEVVFAIAEERLNRVKHYAGFPALAVKACLDAVGAKITDVDHVAVGQDSDANLAKKVQYALANPAKILNFIRLAPTQRGDARCALVAGQGAGS